MTCKFATFNYFYAQFKQIILIDYWLLIFPISIVLNNNESMRLRPDTCNGSYIKVLCCMNEWHDRPYEVVWRLPVCLFVCLFVFTSFTRLRHTMYTLPTCLLSSPLSIAKFSFLFIRSKRQPPSIASYANFNFITLVFITFIVFV